jgi:protein arginine kinase activator
VLLCQICRQREATVHFTQIVNQQKVEMYVCEQCARENSELKININKLLSGIMGTNLAGITGEPFLTKKCEACGLSVSEFNKTGMLGCVKCYETFGDSIKTMLKRIHGNVKHHGKIPKKLSGKIEEAKTLQDLKSRLQQCIINEDYEQAAQLRDQIRAMEKQAKGNEAG